MKRLALPLILALAVGCAWGQTEGLITLPYAVPEFPAFKALNITPSADLTPASAQQLATILADNFQGGDSTFPNTLALEIAPMILFKPGFLLEDYLKAAWLYDSGISLASTTTDSLTKASLGLRLCLIDRSRVPGIEALFEAGRTRDVIYSDLEDAFLAEHELEELEDPAVQAMLREECDRLYALQVRDGKRQFSARNWNRMKLQLAVAVVGNSPNALCATWSSIPPKPGWSFPLTPSNRQNSCSAPRSGISTQAITTPTFTCPANSTGAETKPRSR